MWGLTGDAYLRHIAGQTHTQVVLRGCGSGIMETSEPLHILVTGGEHKSVDEAAK